MYQVMKEKLKHSIGLRVKSARQQKGLTQAELAEAIDKAFETISNIERGKTAPSFGTLADISVALGVPMREFFEIEEEDLSDDHQRLIMRVNTLVNEMTQQQLDLLLRLGTALVKEGGDA